LYLSEDDNRLEEEKKEEWGQVYIRSTRLGREEAREESALGNGAARLVPCSLDHAVVSGPEAELKDVSRGNFDGARVEREVESTNSDGDGDGSGLREQARGYNKKSRKHGWGSG